MPSPPPSTCIGHPEPSETAPCVSVVIVSYNTRDFTLNAVRSVRESCGSLPAEIIVVDNASSDGSVEAVRTAFPSVIVLERPNNGFAAGNNHGFEVARGRYVLLLNPDVEVLGPAVTACVRYMDANPQVGVLGCRLIHRAGSLHPTIFRFVTLSQLFFNILVNDRTMRRTRWLGDPGYAALSLDQAHDVDVVAGCFMLVRREAIQDVGGMDERFFLYSEESEWCFRMRRAGWTVRYFPGAEAFHHGGASTEQHPVLVAVELAKSQILYLLLTRGRAVALAGAILMLVATSLRLVLPDSKRTFPRSALRARWRVLLGTCWSLSTGNKIEHCSVSER